ncbi:MAG: DNA topoisomerase IV subunit A [Bacilli bacterium]|nr:DNA topoisomerase IV subunit A [Bacilli bacterium]
MATEKSIIEKIYDFALEEIMGDRFGKYSKEIIQDRALPDVRDGLKPVQRRILYSMYTDHNTYDKPYRKCAKAVGDVMGNYHPHGDSSIYEAMIRMSQKWKMRETFVDVHGNNGSIDGDGPAAYRYTEARLTKLANVMLKDINKETVEMAYNYSDTLLEPTVLPASFPNLLVNGSTGISAGYATNIPPHNLGEVIDATIKRIENPNCRLDTILDIIKGPDFPTGGVVEGKDAIRKAYETGRGKVVLKSHIEIVKEKGKNLIVVNDIPYEVVKEQLRLKINEIRVEKKVDGIIEVRDESDKDNMAKLIIELKKDANADLILNYLLKNTDLQINYNYNVVAIVNRRPKTLGILEILDAFIEHQKDVVTRRTKFELDHALARLHIVEGLMKAMSILDEVIKVIRASKNKADAILNLEKEFGFSNLQADAIVTMQLYRLTNTDVVILEEEMAKLKQQIDIWNKILANEEALKHVMKTELKIIKKEYATPRLTKIKDEITEIKIDMASMIPKENVVVIVTNEGYIKRVNLKSYASSNGEETTLKPGDYIIGFYEVNTLDTILVFTNLGNYLYIPVHKIPEGKWKDLGKHVNNIVTMATDEKVVSSMVYDDKKRSIVLFTKQGMIKQSILEDFEVSRYSKTLTAIKLKTDDELVNVCQSDAKTMMVSKNGYYLQINTEEIPVVGPKASGVKGINLKEDELVSGFAIKANDEYVNVITENKTAKRVKISDLEMMSRAKRGNLLIKKTKTVTYFVKKAFATEARDVICLKIDNDINELKNSEISIMDLASTGSNITKKEINDVFVKSTLCSYLKKETKETSVKEKIEPEEKIQELTLDDFLDDFKL